MLISISPVHLPLLATLRSEAADLLRNTSTSAVDERDSAITLLDTLLSVLQGICLIAVRSNGTFQAEEETSRNVREALGQEWVAEVCDSHPKSRNVIQADRKFRKDSYRPVNVEQVNTAAGLADTSDP